MQIFVNLCGAPHGSRSSSSYSDDLILLLRGKFRTHIGDETSLYLSGVCQLPLVLDCQQDDFGFGMRVQHDVLANDELAQIG